MLSHYSVNYFSSYLFYIKEYIAISQQMLSYLQMSGSKF